MGHPYLEPQILKQKWVFEFIGHPKDDIVNFCLHESPCDKPHRLYWMPQYPNLKRYPHFYSAAIPSTPLTFTNMAKYRPYIRHTPEDPSFPSQTNVIHCRSGYVQGHALSTKTTQAHPGAELRSSKRKLRQIFGI